MAKKLKTARIDNVRISTERPAATVKIKEVKPGVFRATCRGEKPIFVKDKGNKVLAGVRGDTPVAARTREQAFARAVKACWA